MSATLDAAIAANRFGLGAREGDLPRIGPDARAWLEAQLKAPGAFAIPANGLPNSAAAGLALAEYLQERRDQRADTAKPDAANPRADAARPLAEIGQTLAKEASARTAKALQTDTPFAERLALFWCNHFTVAATKFQTIAYAGVYEREAVRANLSGSFEDLLVASVTHPGMLVYLDQVQSVGPNSLAGRVRGLGLNENLAREILELHTLGAQGGYTQADVTEFAKALTGWSLVTPRTRRFAGDKPMGTAAFIPALHEPGARTVLGKRYPEGGADQARAILKDLAAHPATARRVALKLAGHVCGDQPANASIAALERAFRQSDGDLPTLHRALIALPEAWSREPRKFKTPNEFLISALRLVGETQVEPRALAGGYALLGQPPYRAPSPEGWPDDMQSWAAPDALMKRLEWAQALGSRVGRRARPEDVFVAALGPLASGRAREAVARAESPAQGLALALMSPEFQRR